MKALSLTPWWAWLVAGGHKSIENRKWNTSFRGTFLIHASLGKSAHRVEVLEVLTDMRLDDSLGTKLPGDEVERGGIVGVATIVSVAPPRRLWGMFGNPLLEERDRRWHFLDQYGFVLADVRRLSFVPCKGALGFWEVPTDIAAQIQVAA